MRFPNSFSHENCYHRNDYDSPYKHMKAVTATGIAYKYSFK